jgi:hypothetical protein
VSDRVADVCNSALQRSSCYHLEAHQLFITWNGRPLEPTATLPQAGVERGSTLWLKANPAAISYSMGLEEAVAALDSLPMQGDLDDGRFGVDERLQLELALGAALAPLRCPQVDVAAVQRLARVNLVKVCVLVQYCALAPDTCLPALLMRACHECPLWLQSPHLHRLTLPPSPHGCCRGC